MSAIGHSAMRVRVKIVVQAVLLCLAAALSTLCLYHSLHLSGDPKKSQPSEAWQERAPRSLSYGSRDYETVSNGLPLPQYDNNEFQQPFDPDVTPSIQLLTSLSDVFISVKTTSNYHKSRLDVILKTWFSLAKEEVSHIFFIFIYIFFLVIINLINVK